MISYLPQIYPDELVYSWLCRYYVHSGFISNRDAFRTLFCKKSDTPNKEFIGHLNNEAKATITKVYSLEDLVLYHTMYPQYVMFSPKEKKISVLRQLCDGSCNTGELFSSFTKNSSEYNLKFCPLCVKEDRSKYGETYWHRKHQIRGIDICAKHMCRLQFSNVSSISHNDFLFSPAEETVDDCLSVVLEKDGARIQFAEYVVHAFSTKINFENDAKIDSVLYNCMADTQYLIRSRDNKMAYRISQLANDLKHYYDRMRVTNVATFSRIQRILQGSLFNFIAICQIAFFLQIDVSQLVQNDSNNSDRPENIFTRRSDCPNNWDSYDEQMVPVCEQVAKSIYYGHQNDGKIGFVSIKKVCQELDIPFSRLGQMPRCQMVLSKYMETYEEYWARKIIWAYTYLKEERPGKDIFWSDVRKLSGVKKTNFDRVIPPLKKYGEVANIIIDIVKGDKK